MAQSVSATNTQLAGAHQLAVIVVPVNGGYAFADQPVRLITGREAERLQGFPDGWTLVPYRSGMMSDRARRSMLGNSFAVPVIRWIGERLQAAHYVSPDPVYSTPLTRS